MIVAAARQLNLGCGLALLAVATFVSVNPQCVNVSPLYSGTAMIAGLLWASSFLVKALQSDGSPDLWKCAVPLGLFAASLIALKTTLGFFASLYVAVFLAALLSIARPAQVMRLGCSIAVILLTTLLPWLVVLLTTYGTGPELNNSTNPLAARYPSIWARDIGSLWSTRELLYGGNQINYTFLGALLGATGLVGLGLLFRRRACLGDASWLLATLPAAAAAFPAFLINVHLFDGPTGVRYTCPIFLAVFPLVVTSVAAILQRRVAKVAVDADAPLPPQRLDLRLRARQWAPAALLVTVIVAFAPVTLRRVEQLVQARNQLAFPFDQGYLDHNHYVFSRPVSERWREIQAHTVRGEPLLAWVVAPFQLDFSRNRILTVTEPGLVNPLLQFPAGAPPQELAHFLRAWGVRYVLMNNNRHVSAGVKDLPAAWNARFPLYGKIDAYSTYAREALERLLQQSPILHRSDTLVLFELTDHEKSLPRLMTQRQ
ncbi:MAG: hypothetical protein L0Y58_06455 [Verrucomicrobia subdivision 3 bacterium]|nr:hypothetical protein [Limisphaerales bacterium]